MNERIIDVRLVQGPDGVWRVAVEGRRVPVATRAHDAKREIARALLAAAEAKR